jgi:hypothetical protein
MALRGSISILHTSIVSHHDFIVSVCGPSWLHLKALQLLNFAFDADPDPEFHSKVQIRIQLPKIMRIRIRNPDRTYIIYCMVTGCPTK